jgi:hypothetical protein
MSQSNSDQNESQMNGQIVDDFMTKWCFDCQQLYKIAVKFYRGLNYI